MMAMRISMVLAGLVAFSAVACGGSSDDGGDKGGNGSTTVSTSIPENTKASDLTQTQTEELCDAAGEAAKAALSGPELKAASCGFSAYIGATLLQSADKCQELYSECMKAPEETSGGTSNQGDDCKKPSSACTATVGEIEKCWSDAFASTKAAFAALPGCDDVGKDIAMDSTPQGDVPASCKIVEQKCPEAVKTVATPELPGIEGDGASDNSAPSAPGSNG
jgi:hypothetical protein